jgi:hypothetical protein
MEGVFGVGNGGGEFPSLADTIAAVRRDLSAAQTAGLGQAVQFRAGPWELELEVAVTGTRGVEGGVQIWVLTLGGKLERERASTQRIKVTLQPVDRFTGKDALIGDIGQESGHGEPSSVSASRTGFQQHLHADHRGR